MTDTPFFHLLCREAWTVASALKKDLRDSRNCSCNMSQYNLQNLWCNCFYYLEVRSLETYHLVKILIDKCFRSSLDHVQAGPTKGWGYSTVLIAFYSSESVLQWPMSQFTLVLSKWGDAGALNESQVIMNKQSYCGDLPSGAIEIAAVERDQFHSVEGVKSGPCMVCALLGT